MARPSSRLALWGAIASLLGIPLALLLFFADCRSEPHIVVQVPATAPYRDANEHIDSVSADDSAPPVSREESQLDGHAPQPEQGNAAAMLPTPVPDQEYKSPVFVGNSLYPRSYRIEIMAAERIGDSKLRLHVLVRSQVDHTIKMRLEEPEQTAYIVDPQGVRYFLASEESLTGEFPTNVDVRGSLTFLGPPSATKQITVVFRYRVGSGRADEVIFRNLDLDLMKLVQPVPAEHASRVGQADLR